MLKQPLHVWATSIHHHIVKGYEPDEINAEGITSNGNKFSNLTYISTCIWQCGHFVLSQSKKCLINFKQPLQVCLARS